MGAAARKIQGGLFSAQSSQGDATHALVKIPAAKPSLFQEVKSFSQQQIASLRAQSTKECPCFSGDQKVQFWELFLRCGLLFVEDVSIEWEKTQGGGGALA